MDSCHSKKGRLSYNLYQKMKTRSCKVNGQNDNSSIQLKFLFPHPVYNSMCFLVTIYSHANHHTWIFYFQPAGSFDLLIHQEKFQARGVGSEDMWECLSLQILGKPRAFSLTNNRVQWVILSHRSLQGCHTIFRHLLNKTTQYWNHHHSPLAKP